MPFSLLVSAHAVHSTAEAVTLVLAAVRAGNAASSRRAHCFRLPNAAHTTRQRRVRILFDRLARTTDAERASTLVCCFDN